MNVDWRELAPWLGAAIGLVVLAGFFSGSEVALFGLRRVEREQLARSGRRVDEMVLRLLAQPRRLVTSVLVGSEAVGMTLAALVVGVFGKLLPEASPLTVVACAVAVAVPAMLLVGAVIPRTVAIKAPIAWARAAARPLAIFAFVVSPLRWVVQVLAEGLGRVFGGGGRSRAPGELSEEEFRKLVDAGSAQGQVDARERRLIHKVFEFGDKNVGQIMTPRDKVFALAYDLPMARLAKEVAARGFSRVPIYQRSLDNIRGILNAKDLVLATAGQAPARTLSELLHEPLFVPRTTPLARLFRTFKQRKVHMALVVSEYGGLLGLVTMEDLLEQLFGEIRDERENLQTGTRRGRGGRTPLPGSVPAVAVEGGQVVIVDATAAAPTGGDGEPEVEAERAPVHTRSSRGTGLLATVGTLADTTTVAAMAAEAAEVEAEAAAAAADAAEAAAEAAAAAAEEPPAEITKPFDLDDLAETGRDGGVEGGRR